MNLARKLPKYVRLTQPRRNLAELVNRKYLPGSTSSTFPKNLNPPKENFPFIISAKDVPISNHATAGEYAEICQKNFGEILNEHGAVLFRDFPINGHQDFNEFFNGLGKFNSMDYVGGAAPRKVVGKDVYTASDEPPDICIEGHNEMAYMPKWPDVLMFYCNKPADPGCGGETVIIKNRDILKNLDADIVGRFAKLGVHYNYHWADKSLEKYKSWQEVFQTEDRSEVEKYLNSIGADYKWEENGSLIFGYGRPAMIDFKGELIWFNHITRKHASSWKYNHPFWEKFTDLPYDRFPTHSLYGDGSEIPEEYVQHIREVSWQVAVGFQLQKGDVIALDNLFVQHSRLSFTGERKLMVAMLQHGE